MEDKSLISVIVPVYNVEPYLDRCVQSIVDQTYKNIEIILVDDGSPDNCPKMCDEWAKRDSRIKVIHKTNGGLSDARNAGLDVCKGEYITFVDSDDYINVRMIERLYDLIVKYNADFSMCKYKEFANMPVYDENKFETITLFEDDDVIRQIYYSSLGLIVTAWAKLYKQEVFDNLRFPEGKLHEDEYIWADVLHNTKSFVHTSEQLYYYYKNCNGITKTYCKKNIEDTLEAFDNRYAFLQRNYPHNKRLNDNHYLSCLRALGVKSKNYKVLQKQIWNKYKQFYKIAECKDFKNFCYRHCRFLFEKLADVKFKLSQRRK